MSEAGRPISFRLSPTRARMRRTIDVATALALLILSAPVLAVACAAILVEDGRPIFFRQRRVGRFEKTFTIIKLRTMYRAQCGDRLKPREGRDPRITRVGRILRKFSIDELPQLINVLRGEMSVIGPRPEMPHIVKRYKRPWQHLRHLMMPGITCFWQTEARGVHPLEDPNATEFDLLYVRRASPLTDVRILAKTVSSVLTARGAV